MTENPMDAFRSKFEELLRLRVKADETAAAAKTAKDKYKQAESALYQELKESGIRGRHEFDFGGTLGSAKFQRTATTFGRVLNKSRALEALKASGHDDAIIEESIAKGRLNELVRDWLENKTDFPEGIDHYENEYISISHDPPKDGLTP